MKTKLPRNYMSKTLLLPLALVFVGLAVAGTTIWRQAQAQTAGNGFSVSPARIIIDSTKAKPGASITTEEISVTNVTSEPFSARVDARDFKASEA